MSYRTPPADVASLGSLSEPVPVRSAAPSRHAGDLAWLYPPLRVALLVSVDLTALTFAGAAAYLAWAGTVLEQPLSVYADVGQLLLLLPAGYAAAGLYPGFGIGAVETIRRFSFCTTFGFLAIAAATFAFKLPADHSRITFVIAWAGACVVVPLFRFLALSVTTRRRWWCEPTLLFGDAPWLRETIESLEYARSIGFRPVGIVSDDAPGASISGVPVLSSHEAELSVAAGSIRTVMVAESAERLDQLSLLQKHFRRVILVTPHRAMPVEGARAFNLGGVLGIEFRNNLLQWQNRVLKRIIDLALGSAMLAVSLPFVALFAAYIKVRSPGPAFFVQSREGYQGREVRIWKLRTMRADAEERLGALLREDPRIREEWESKMKLRRDPRIVPGAGFLRRFSLDELPQIFGVIRGELSLVGPRPFPSYHVQKFSREFREMRQRVRPGLTGLWQVLSRSDGGLEEQELYDSYYVRNWSLWLDLYLIGRTVVEVVRGKGAY